MLDVENGISSTSEEKSESSEVVNLSTQSQESQSYPNLDTSCVVSALQHSQYCHIPVS